MNGSKTPAEKNTLTKNQSPSTFLGEIKDKSKKAPPEENRAKNPKKQFTP